MSSLLEMMHVLSLQFLFIQLIQMSHDWQQCLVFFLPKTGEVAQYSEDNCPKDVKV